jgi:predicted HTH domain antitoxin
MQITLNIPEQYLVDTTPVELGRDIKLYAALTLFRAGKLSAGAAAEFAEVDRFRFAEACVEHGIPLVDYSADELRAEMESLRELI